MRDNLRFNSDIGIVLPTYCEAENIYKLIKDILALKLNALILVVDDSSPDGTAQIVRELQKESDNILLIERAKKNGLGSAITDAFKFFLALEKMPKKIIVMDADFSHNPQQLPSLLDGMVEGCGIVIGSRYCSGGRIEGWSFSRKLISRIANRLARSSLKIKLNDCTSGYRCYSVDFLKVAVDSLHSQTYEIQIETVRQAKLNNFKVIEVPISFVNRKRGKSKLAGIEIRSFFLYILKAGLHK
ncbi:MAG: polyprenol monophosphomannose synthase [Candidatus Bathyarchaeota archaeon]|nr:polyprenol monophosphomannose synthase [Candidatus Bathyarchaeota archaeon]